MAPGERFETFRTFVLVYDSSERERGFGLWDCLREFHLTRELPVHPQLSGRSTNHHTDEMPVPRLR